MASNTTLQQILDAVAEESAQRVLGMIAEDVSAGIIPWDVPDFSALHDFVDANLYLIELVGEVAFDTRNEKQMTYLADIEERVAKALNGGCPTRWQTDPDGYRRWMKLRKRGLLASRAAAFGLSLHAMAAHDGVEVDF